jgi:hypothetical protein
MQSLHCIKTISFYLYFIKCTTCQKMFQIEVINFNENHSLWHLPTLCTMRYLRDLGKQDLRFSKAGAILECA